MASAPSQLALPLDLAPGVCRIGPVPLTAALVPARTAVGDATVAVSDDVRRHELVPGATERCTGGTRRDRTPDEA